MKLKYLSTALLIVLLSSCDYAKSKVEEGKNKVQSKVKNIAAETIDSFLELPDRTTQRETSIDELYGSWIVTKGTLGKKNEKKYPDWEGVTFPAMSFTLQENNQISGLFNSRYIKEKNQDDFFVLSDYKDTLTIMGQWDLEGDTISGYRVVTQFEFRKNHTHFYSLNCTEEDGSLILWNYIGDPDDVKYQDYKRLKKTVYNTR